MGWMLFVTLLMAVAIGVAWLMTQSGDYEVRRSRLFDQDIELLFDKIRDLRSWPDWSPWLLHEPDTRLEYSENCDQEGGFYSWDGQLVGAGKLTHLRFTRPLKIEQRIEFTRPFRSVCEVAFEFADKDGQTEVSWIMRGRMPFLFRFMTARTVAMISKDYDLGLAMLAGLLDPQVEHPRIEFSDSCELQPQHCLCHGFEGGGEAMQSAMQREFPRLIQHVQQHGDVFGPPMTAYHKVDPQAMYFVCDLAVPASAGIEAGEYRLMELPGGRYFKVSLRGDYRFLELAWYAAMAHVRMLKLKLDTGRPSLEVYENDAREIPDSNQWQTTLYIPLRS